MEPKVSICGSKSKVKILKLLKSGLEYNKIKVAKESGVSYAASYILLKELQEKGLIESYEKGRARPVRITQRGMKVIIKIDELELLL